MNDSPKWTFRLGVNIQQSKSQYSTAGLFRFRRFAISFAFFVLSFSGICQPVETASSSELPVIRSIAQLLALSKSEVAKGYPVDVEGVVTYSEGQWGYYFLQDGTDAVFVSRVAGGTPAVSGERVRVRGRSRPGQLASSIADAQTTHVGSASLPPGTLHRLEVVHSGSTDCQWVGIEGVVRRVVSEEGTGRVYLEILSHEGQIRGYVQGETWDSLSAEFDRAVVQFFGACGARIDSQQQMIGSDLFAPSKDHVRIVSRPNTPGEELPVSKLTELELPAAPDTFPKAMRLQGRITIAQEDRDFFFQDNTGGIFVTDAADFETVSGQSVEILGWPVHRETGWVLLPNAIQTLEESFEILPVEVTASQLMDPKNDARLVRVQAYFLEVNHEGGKTVLDFQFGDQFLIAEVLSDFQEVNHFEPNSLVEIVGVKTTQAGGTGVIRIIMASGRDGTVVRGPIWWTSERIALTGFGVVVLFLAGVTWVITLRRRVSLQTREIQARLDAETALERKYRDLIENANDMIFTRDLEGNFTSFNNAGLKMIGYTLKDVLNLNIRDLVLPDQNEKDRTRLSQMLDDGGTARYEVEFQKRDARIVAVELNMRLIKEDGRVVGVQGIGRDVSERKMTEDALRHARDAAEAATRVKSEFLATMSHEIRTPMNGVIGMTELLLETDLDDEQREFAQVTQTSADSLLRIIDDILDFSKMESGKLEMITEQFSLRDLVEETCELLAEQAHRKGLRFECWIDPALPALVQADAGRLRQVLTNLAGNAVKFTENGSVRIRVSEARRHDGFLVASVEIVDTGIGISEKDQAKLFEPFSQADSSSKRKFEGTGLGLAISRRIVTAMEGEIGLQSEPGDGTKFFFNVRLGIAEMSIQEPRNSNGERTVLVATPSEFLFETIASYLDGVAAVRRIDHAFELTGINVESRIILLMEEEIKTSKELCGVIERINAECPGVETVRILPFATFKEKSAGPNERMLTRPLRMRHLLSLVNGTNVPVNREVRSNAPDRDSTNTFSMNDTSRHALVVENNLVNRQVTQRVLEKLGFQVTTAESGLQAIDALDKVLFDILVMDWHMPEMDGLEATRRIRQNPRTKNVKIVAMTANASAGDREKCLAAGMDGYLSKPLQIDLLREAVLEFVDVS